MLCNFHLFTFVTMSKNNDMTIYMNSLRSNVARNAQLKLSKHRELGVKSNLSVFEVAALMDKLKNAERMEDHKNSVFFSAVMN
ncbi:MAG: hypothetical protein RL037_819 [Bacteroidota bacterium]|jgi:hypothetical protein